MTGNSNPKVLNVKPEIAQTSIASKIHQEVIFQNNLNESETIFAKCPTISKIHKKSEITISQTFTNKNKGQSINTGNHHLL